MKPIYLDHNSTTPLDPRVEDAMVRCQRDYPANPASQHRMGRESRQVLEDTREKIASILGAEANSIESDQLIFTSGGTESNNLAVRGLLDHEKESGRLIISSIEHPSIAGPAEFLSQAGWDLQCIRVSHDGVVEVSHLQELIDDRTRLVSVMLGNNETGVLQPVEELAAISRQANVPFHTDAVQAVGKIDVKFRRLGVSTMSASAHKFHGPPGIGILILHHGVTLHPIQFGGFQQMGYRPGTEPVALAVGMCVALEIWHQKTNQEKQLVGKNRDLLEQLLRENIRSKIIISGQNSSRLPHTTNIAFPGLNRQALLMALDQVGVACSTGSACASGSSDPSSVLLAMGCDPAVVEGALRFSLGARTTPAEIEQAAQRISKVVNDLHG